METKEMKKWSTNIYAKSPLTGEIIRFIGPIIEAQTAQLAFDYCQNNGLGYCYIADECVAIVDAKTGETTDFETTQNN